MKKGCRRTNKWRSSCSAFLGKYDFCLEAVSVEAEEFSDLKRVPTSFRVSTSG